MNEELARYLANVVVKSGGDVTLTHDELNRPVDLNLSVDENEQGEDIGLRFKAVVTEEQQA
jgi:predicted RNA-binding protein YlqC (UPF0109 family)